MTLSSALPFACIMVISSLPTVSHDFYRLGFLLSTSHIRHENNDDLHIIVEKYNRTNDRQQKRERLDALALYLKADPTFRAYIMSYGGRRSCRGEASLRAQSAKKYLTKVRGIDGQRVIILDGGHLEEWSVELLVGPQSAPAPLLHSSLSPNQVRISRKCKSICNELGKLNGMK